QTSPLSDRFTDCREDQGGGGQNRGGQHRLDQRGEGNAVDHHAVASAGAAARFDRRRRFSSAAATARQSNRSPSSSGTNETGVSAGREASSPPIVSTARKAAAGIRASGFNRAR